MGGVATAGVFAGSAAGSVFARSDDGVFFAVLPFSAAAVLRAAASSWAASRGESLLPERAASTIAMAISSTTAAAAGIAMAGLIRRRGLACSGAVGLASPAMRWKNRVNPENVPDVARAACFGARTGGRRFARATSAARSPPAAKRPTASATSAGVWKRASGDLASILFTAAVNSTGTPSRIERAGGAGFSRCPRIFSNVLSYFGPANGAWPVRSLKSVQPRL